jgi:NAD-dependent dihydropyrimidine dehydrogenase PreA subunit
MSDGVFITISVDESRIKPDVARSLVSICPVDIFGLDGERLIVKPDQVDECTLCELCLMTAPAGALVIHKRYKDEQLVSRGGANDA